MKSISEPWDNYRWLHISAMEEKEKIKIEVKLFSNIMAKIFINLIKTIKHISIKAKNNKQPQQIPSIENMKKIT